LALDKKDKTKCKRFGLWIIRKEIAYLQPYFFYTKRWQQAEKFVKPRKILIEFDNLVSLIKRNSK